MFVLSWFAGHPLRTAVTIAVSLFAALILFAAVNTILAFSGGPGDCTPGGGPITVSAANAASFQQKWNDFDAVLDGGSTSSVIFSESEVSSRADQYFTDESNLDLKDVRVCFHDGYGEASGRLDAILGLGVEIKLKGNVDLTGDKLELDIDDIEFGSVPGFLVDFADAIFSVEGDIEQAVEDIKLKHDYSDSLTEGQAVIDGVP